MYSRILIGFDGSPQSLDALRTADALAGPDATLIVAHVAPHSYAAADPVYEQRRVAGDEQLARARALLPGRPDVELVAPAGRTVAAALHQTAEQTLCDLIVVGSSRRHGAGRVLLGSNAEAALHDAPCAVLVASERPRGAIERIGVGFDGTPLGHQTVHRAGRLAGQLGATLTILGVVDTRHPQPTFGIESGYEDVRQRTRELLGQAEAEAAAAGAPRVRRQLQEGDPVHQLLGLGRESDLLVVGSRRNGPLLRIVLGSVSAAVVRRATCAVLVLPETLGTASRRSASSVGA